ncbi:MAG: hypothetical protein U0105_02160 [Candidatus Obscuribacterales bacterium]
MLNELLKSVLSETAASAVYPQDIFASIDFGDETAAPLRKEDMPSFAGVITREDRIPSTPCKSATRKPHALKVSIDPAEEDLQPWVRPENFERMILPLPYPTEAATITGTRPMLLGRHSH